MAESIIKNSKIVDAMEKNKIFAVVRTDKAQKSIDISKALIDGGINIIEITMGYEDASYAIQELSKNENVSIAAGSVITAEQAEKAIKAGAKLIVSPILEMRLVKLCRAKKIPIVTGAATPTEAYNAWKLGVDIIKIFPAKALGGHAYIKDILTPMPFLHLMPTGGVDFDNFTDYLNAGAVAVGMGNAFYADKTDFSSITKKAKTAMDKLNNYFEKNNYPC
ncbi:MAG: bifunctional 4-hydroxy-2-oxoglutarate aldolase/2-dehydro-3-deoxy-phosphogluconate aldolase [Candidatus Gastranaerophilales bacterium]|nr:bifunctional 4-hydroxy-2-oxoglutarate aldolase/2-dehydro-3-deoxy-phosphogluconate aldolase [Candidatus Gastranaerophilales bacterium]